jgi:hypothetical protein
MEFLQALGTVFGIIAGGGFLVLVFKIGLSWGSVQRDVTTTKEAVERTEVTVQNVLPRVERIEQTLHGPEGNNGMYSELRDMRRRFDDLPTVPKRRRTDRKAS